MKEDNKKAKASKKEVEVVQEEATHQEESKGLGDKVEALIQQYAPRLAKQFENCPSCKKRKRWLNKNINGNFG